MEIKIIKNEIGEGVYVSELYDWLELDRSNYSRWIKQYIYKNPFSEEGKDFSSSMTKTNNGGRPRLEYFVTLDFATKLCMVSNSKKAEEVRNKIINVLKKVQNGNYVTHEQVVQAIRMVKVFSVYEYRKKALDANMKNYLSGALMNDDNKIRDKKFLASAFHTWRNEALSLGKEELDKRVKEYCLLERKTIRKNYTKEQAFALMGDYEQIRTAVWDLLSSKNKSKELIDSICDLAQDIARELKPFLVRLDKSDLFHSKIDTKEVDQIFKDKLID